MTLGAVSLLFLLQAVFGSLVTFVISDRAALGPKYDKFGGWVLLSCLGLAGSLIWGTAFGATATDPERQLGLALAAATVATLGFASVAGWDRPRLESALLGASVLSAGMALTLATLQLSSAAAWGTTGTTLVLAGSAASALVLGFVTWGMILGHWYLISHDLDIAHLGRLVRPLPWILGAKAVVSGLALFVFWDRFLGSAGSLDAMLRNSPDRVLDVVNVWARIPIGLLVPMVLAVMAGVTVAMRKTQPATGILYAMCVLVYMGELMGGMVAGTTGVPF
jgi:hypothetical protein